MKIVLHGSPRTTNRLYKVMCRSNFPTHYMSQEGKALKESYQYEARSQYKGKPLVCPVEITIDLYFKTKRKADWDNFHKLSCDALTGIVWKDDSQIQYAQVRKLYDPKDPRIEFDIQETN